MFKLGYCLPLDINVDRSHRLTWYLPYELVVRFSKNRNANILVYQNLRLKFFYLFSLFFERGLVMNTDIRILLSTKLRISYHNLYLIIITSEEGDSQWIQTKDVRVELQYLLHHTSQSNLTSIYINEQYNNIVLKHQDFFRGLK